MTEKTPTQQGGLSTPEQSVRDSVQENKPAVGSATDSTHVEKAAKENEIEYPHGLKLALIIIALCCAVFLVALDQTIISTAIPKITDEFSSIKDIGWVSTNFSMYCRQG